MSQQIIYVVDDEPLISRLAQVNLERAGYKVLTALDGMEALQSLQSGQVQPDLILLDVMMPFMDGFELMDKLKVDFQLQSIPIVVMTARSRDEDILMGKELGALQYLTKPINPTELISTVNGILKPASETTP